MTIAEPEFNRLAFVGTTNPFRGWRRLIEGTHRLATSSKANLMITNTSGVMAGPGRRLKAAKIAAIQPDLLIGIGTGGDLESILIDHAALRTLRLTRSPGAKRKTSAERRSARRQAFRTYFAEATPQTFDLAALHPAERSPDLWAAGLLVGLADAKGNDVGLGVLLARTPEVITILTPAVSSRVQCVVPGSLLLDEDFSERAVPKPTAPP